MREQLAKRLEELKREAETGQRALAEVEVRQANLRQTLLRISGAIQVLEEMLAEERTGGAQVRSIDGGGAPEPRIARPAAGEGA
jgi:predicted nuclease with TOPRIM domain